MNNLFKKAPCSPKLIPDENWVFPMPPSERSSFSHPPRPDSSLNYSEEVIETVGYRINNFTVES